MANEQSLHLQKGELHSHDSVTLLSGMHIKHESLVARRQAMPSLECNKKTGDAKSPT